MYHKLLSAVSILPVLLVMPAVADVINLNDDYISGDLKYISYANGEEYSLTTDTVGFTLTDGSYAIYSKNGAIGNVGGENTSSITLDAVQMAASAQVDGVLNLKATDNISITSKNSFAVKAGKRGLVSIVANQVDITNKNVLAALWVENDTKDSNGTLATIDIKANDINLSTENGYAAIVALSQGVVNVSGNTTISAPSDAIVARGNATVNINADVVDGAPVPFTKMMGNINFNYDDTTSRTPIDAFVNIVFAGTDSIWTGNTIISYDSEKPSDLSKLIISSPTITLKDGAKWIATEIKDNMADKNGMYYTALSNLNIIGGGTVQIKDKNRGISIDNAQIEKGYFTGGHVQINKTATIVDTLFVGNRAAKGGAIYNSGRIELAGNNVFSGNRAGGQFNDIYNDGVVIISGGDTTMSGGILGDGDFTLSDDATLNLGTAIIQQKNAQIDGVVNAVILDSNNFGRLYGDVKFGDSAELNLNVATVGTYKIFDTDNDFSNINVGTLFDVQNNGAAGVVISARGVDDIAADVGLSNLAAATLVGVVNSGNSVAGINVQRALMRGDADYIEAESVKSAPADKPITHSVSTSVQNQVLSLVASRMAGAVTGRSGGDFVTTGAGMWAHGLINRSKMNSAFHGDTRGMAVGVDATFNRKYTFGMGYAYGDTDVHTGANKTDIESNTLFAYAQYKPSDWFINGAFNYTFADYSTGVNLFGINMTNEYDVDSYGAQLMTGYDFDTGVTPMAGVRYLHISQDDYNNGIAIVKSDDSDFMTGVAGLKYTFDIDVESEFVLRPELRAAATYDFLSDESVSTVLMPGAASYIVNADRLSRFGGEFGIGMAALINGIELSVNYDLDLHKDYTSQTGMLKFRYNF